MPRAALCARAHKTWQRRGGGFGRDGLLDVRVLRLCVEVGRVHVGTTGGGCFGAAPLADVRKLTYKGPSIRIDRKLHREGQQVADRSCGL
jgi:hypothetical protein